MLIFKEQECRVLVNVKKRCLDVSCAGSHSSPSLLTAEEMARVQGEALAKRVELTLATIPATVVPKKLAGDKGTDEKESNFRLELRYEYNREGELRGIDTKEPYIFVSQRHYDALGECVIEHIFESMEALGLQRTPIPEAKENKDQPSSKVQMKNEKQGVD